MNEVQVMAPPLFVDGSCEEQAVKDVERRIAL
jgi:hypothetical protein